MSKELIDRLNNTFRQIREIKPTTRVRKQTFMEIAGYPHFENVISNILAFLFTDSEEHGMRELWLRSLLEAAKIENDISTHNSEVVREQYTDKGNRIDLLVSTENAIICIENKIYAGINNDLDNYESYAKEEGKTPLCILLSLSKIDESDCAGFTNVTYGQLFTRVKANLGEYIQSCDNTWLSYMKDMMTTIESLSGEDDNMGNDEFEKLYMKSYSDIRILDEMRGEYLKKLTAEAQELRATIEKREGELGGRICKNPYKTQKEMRASVYIDFDINENTIIAVETSRDCWGWHIAFLLRKCSDNRPFEKVIKNIETGHKKNKDDIGDKQYYNGQRIITSFLKDDKIASNYQAIADNIIKISNEYIRRFKEEYSHK